MFRIVLSNLFFFFFIAQIFSPYVAGITLYLEVIIALIDPYYRKWVISCKFDRRIYLALFLIPLVFFRPAISIKLLSLAISVSYLFYAYNYGCFYLKRYVCLSIYIAIAQFILFYFVPEASTVLGPTSIATYIWGDYATPTYTNFYEVLWGFIRVSGLSREAGFFASLILAVIVLHYMEWKKESKVISKCYIFLLVLAFLVSLSKMSFSRRSPLPKAFRSPPAFRYARKKDRDRLSWCFQSHFRQFLSLCFSSPGAGLFFIPPGKTACSDRLPVR